MKVDVEGNGGVVGIAFRESSRERNEIGVGVTSQELTETLDGCRVSRDQSG